MEYKYKVCVRCSTYNHALFIEQALNGFTMQQTDFPYVCCILDDASTDNTPNILENYMAQYFNVEDKDVAKYEETEDYRLCFARHKTNTNCHFAIYYLKYNHYKKKDKLLYIAEWTHNALYNAVCEGDDYWVAPDKLQKQANYLDEHPSCGMVYTAYRQQNDVTCNSTDIFTQPFIKHDENFKWRLLEQKVMVSTPTAMLRSELWHELRSIKDDYQGFLMGDTQTWFNAARLSQIGYIPEVTSVYRKQQSGATATFDESRRAAFIRSCLDLHLHLSYKYDAPLETIRRIKSLFGFSCINLYFRTYDYDKARLLNSDHFHNNKLISMLIGMAEKLHIKYFHGLGTILRTSATMGLINMK